jgi:hypothetical protein
MYIAKKEEEAERMDGRRSGSSSHERQRPRVVRFHTAATASNRVKPLFLYSSLSCCSAGRGEEEEEMENVDVSLDFCVSDALRVCVPW